MDQEFSLWQVEGLPLRVEYSPAVLEELRVYAEEGFQKIPHGGIEMGALLFGDRDEQTVRIREWRPISCDHARGPGFALSPADREALTELIENSGKSPELAGLVVVGWFHTHTRSKIFLSADDLSIHEAFFTEPWQVALVMRPQKDQAPVAGFFARNAAGQLNGEASPAEFVVRPDPLQSLKPKRASAAGTGGRVMSGKPEVVSRVPEALTRHERPMFRPLGEPRTPPPAGPMEAERGRRAAAQDDDTSAAGGTGLTGGRYQSPRSSVRLPFPLEPELAPPPPPVPDPHLGSRWAALALLSCALLAGMFGWWRLNHASQPVTLKVAESDQSLLISWDNGAPSAAKADRAVLRIVDGSTVRTVPLSMTAVRSGSVTYMREADDVEIRLTLFRDNQQGEQAFAHFIGAPISRPAAGATSLGEPSRQGLQLQSDVTRLRETLRMESDRTERLREELALLEKTGASVRRR